jgi:EAL domain-containing protein (putative c-di-GMP-specific phosphodiesterase class I)
MLTDENDAVIVRTTTDLAHNLGMRVVAEGVESQEIEASLRLMGCDVAQGYHYSRPVTCDEFMQLVANPARLRLRIAK